MSGNSGSLVRRFGGLIAAVAAIGLALALYADRSSIGIDDGYWDAVREVGGAIVSGAVLAALVVWFEDRREDERVEREADREDKRFSLESAREDQAAKRAWRREIDIRLVAVVRTDLMAGRVRRIERLDANTRRRRSTDIAFARDEFRGRSFNDSFAEVDSLLEFLRDTPLRTRWNEWSDAFDSLEEVPGPAVQSESSPFGPLSEMPPSRDPKLHGVALGAETSAWAAFLAAVNVYVADYYPTE